MYDIQKLLTCESAYREQVGGQRLLPRLAALLTISKPAGPILED